MAASYRFATDDDVDAMAEVHTRSWQAAYTGLLDQAALDALDPADRAAMLRPMVEPAFQQERGVTMIVAEVDGALAGHVVVQVHEEHCIMLMLYLDPPHWGTGIGTALHDMAVRVMHRAGRTTGTLRVLEGNDRAIAFYERHGWTMTGQRFDDEIFGIALVDLEMSRELSVDLLAANRDYWDTKAPAYADVTTWSPEISWGIFGVPDNSLRNGEGIFPDVAGLDVVELGCGTAYVSNWAQLRGARTATGIDNSPEQLATAARFVEERESPLTLVRGDAHHLPYADESFDVAINEYGAAIWCDPHTWIPEAARVLRPGGLLWFLGNSVIAMLCVREFEDEAATPEMLRPQRGMRRFDWIDTPNVEFHVSHGETIQILNEAGFEIQALHELYAPQGADTRYGFVDSEWASQWPHEEVWVARKRAL